jgi:dienelactone hydrolase
VAAETTDLTVEVTAGPRPATLRARLHVPAGQAPFPALVFLHGCSGLGRRQDAWADELTAEGYVVLVLDSFGARGLTRVCGDRQKFPGHDRAEDAFAAVRVLQRRAEVDRARIGLIGWSHGGWTTLWALAGQRAHPNEPVRAAITFYPVCSDSGGWKDAPPLLMLLGGSDDWTPAERCTRLAHTVEGFGQRVETVVYPGAHHAFDDAGLRRPTRVRDALGGKGATIAYDANAHSDARQRVRAFLARELKGP